MKVPTLLAKFDRARDAIIPVKYYFSPKITPKQSNYGQKHSRADC